MIMLAILLLIIDKLPTIAKSNRTRSCDQRAKILIDIWHALKILIWLLGTCIGFLG